MLSICFQGNKHPDQKGIQGHCLKFNDCSLRKELRPLSKALNQVLDPEPSILGLVLVKPIPANAARVNMPTDDITTSPNVGLVRALREASEIFPLASNKPIYQAYRKNRVRNHLGNYITGQYWESVSQSEFEIAQIIGQQTRIR